MVGGNSMVGAIRLERFRDFLRGLGALLEEKPEEPRILREGGRLLQRLVSHDDWLPESMSRADAHRYQQYLLHADGQQRFSVVSFVWGPGQHTPVHDHRVWGLVGMLRGLEYSQGYRRDVQGRLHRQGQRIALEPGQVVAVSPRIGDIHEVSNAYADRVSISIHVYGANIGAVRRAVYLPDGEEKPFISGYSNSALPNIWDLSKEVAV